MPCTPRLLESLSTSLEGMKKGLAQGDHELYVDEALNFHRLLIEASGNRMFLRTWESFHWDVRARIVLRRIVEVGGAFAPVLDIHDELLNQMRAGNVPGAIVAIRAVFTYLDSFIQQADAAPTIA
jgi:DNA-binding GntR family transcriptional regulator